MRAKESEKEVRRQICETNADRLVTARSHAHHLANLPRGFQRFVPVQAPLLAVSASILMLSHLFEPRLQLLQAYVDVFPLTQPRARDAH